MKPKRITHGPTAPALLGAILIANLVAGGCVSSSRVTNAPTESVGQQLIDLDKAYKEGIITEDQYNRLKNQVIKKNE